MPILASATGETERIVNEAECGVCCKLGDAESLVSAIGVLRNSDLGVMGQNALRYVDRFFDRTALMDSLDQILGTPYDKEKVKVSVESKVFGIGRM